MKLIAPPGYGPVVPLDKARHAGLGLRPDRSYGWCANLNAVYIGAAEFVPTALHYPIVFVREPRTDAFMPIAVLGLRQDQNLFVNGGGHWRDRAYVPAYFRRHPFCIAEVPGQGGAAPQQLVCVQEDHLGPSPKPLFAANGEPTADWLPIQKLLESIEGARQQAAALARRLDALGLFTAFDALAVPHGGEPLRLGGMFRVDEDRLHQLGGRELKELMPKGELRAIYAHLVSLENFARLLDLAHGR